MIFISDNATGVCTEIMQALLDVNEDTAVGYGNDEVTGRLEPAFDLFFETSVRVFPVAVGTAANALAVATLCPSWGAIFCHADSHLHISECGAPEMFTGGAKLVDLGGDQAKLNPDDLDRSIRDLPRGNPHVVQPAVVSISQITEAGTVYTLDEIRALTDVAHSHNLYFHMDGARFANGAVALGCSPAEMTWKAGVDVMSFGASKNGAMMAEAVVFFNAELVRDFEFRRKRSGHLVSKMRFVSAQLEAYISNDLWHRNATHANRMAHIMGEMLGALDGVDIIYPVEANQVFVRFPEVISDRLRDNGYEAYASRDVVRLVTSFNTTEEEVGAFIRTAVG